MSHIRGTTFYFRHLPLGLLIIGALVLVATLRPGIDGDGWTRFDALTELLDHGHIVPMKYSYVQVLLSTPLYWASQLMGTDPRVGVAYFNVAVVIALGSVSVFFAARRWGLPQALVVGLLSLSTGLLPNYVHFYYAEVLTSLLLVVGVLAFRSVPWLGAIFLGVGAANTPSMLVPLSAAVLTYMVVRRFRGKRVWWALASVFMGATIFALENALKFGSPFATNYLNRSESGGINELLPFSGHSGFSYPIVFGLLAVLFSFGKGIVIYLPPLALIFSQKLRASLSNAGFRLAPALVFSAVLVLLYSMWWAWYGGWTWGPRFFLILSFAAAALWVAGLRYWPRTWRTILGLLALLVWSTWVGVEGGYFDQFFMTSCTQNNYELEFMCWYVPEYSALFRPFVVYGGWPSFQFGPIPIRTAFVVWQVAVMIYAATLLFRPWPRAIRGLAE